MISNNFGEADRGGRRGCFCCWHSDALVIVVVLLSNCCCTSIFCEVHPLRAKFCLVGSSWCGDLIAKELLLFMVLVGVFI